VLLAEVEESVGVVFAAVVEESDVPVVEELLAVDEFVVLLEVELGVSDPFEDEVFVVDEALESEFAVVAVLLMVFPELVVLVVVVLEELVPTLPVTETTGVVVDAVEADWLISEFVPPATKVTSPAISAVEAAMLLLPVAPLAPVVGEAEPESWTSPTNGIYCFFFCEHAVRTVTRIRILVKNFVFIRV
jgi:hypothetical protein